MEIDSEFCERMETANKCFADARPPKPRNQVFPADVIQIGLEKSKLGATKPFILLKTLIEQLHICHPLVYLQQRKLVLNALENKGILFQIDNISDALLPTRYFFAREIDGVRAFGEIVDHEFLVLEKYKSTEVWAMVEARDCTLDIFMCRLMAERRPRGNMELREFGDEAGTKLPNPPTGRKPPFVRGQTSNFGQPDQIAGARIHERQYRHLLHSGPYGNFIFPVGWKEPAPEERMGSREITGTESNENSDGTMEDEDWDFE